MRIVEQTRPTIGIGVGPGASAECIDLIRVGMEEEGVPGSVTRADAGDAAALAHGAALASRLGVGVGVDGRRVAVTTEKLDAARPYLVLDVDAGPERVCAMGADAARLVKRMPLIGIGGDRSGSSRNRGHQ